jgi:ferredoxin-type protein NapF
MSLRFPQTLPDPARRNLLRGDPLRKPSPLRPPWTDEARLTAACVRCGDCVSACPEQVLRTGDGGFPEFHVGAPGALCTFCGACAAACEVDVFDLSRVPPWRVTARIDDGACLAQKGIHCEGCRDSCLEDAIVFRPRIGGPPVPQIALADCSGCGGCLGTCPVQALDLHQPARPVEVA